MIRIDTTTDEACHGRKPRQPYGQGPGSWAFQMDLHPEPVFLHGTCQDTLKQAKKRAQYSVTVLP
jgi:hypothetical protein